MNITGCVKERNATNLPYNCHKLNKQNPEDMHYAKFVYRFLFWDIGTLH